MARARDKAPPRWTRTRAVSRPPPMAPQASARNRGPTDCQGAARSARLNWQPARRARGAGARRLSQALCPGESHWPATAAEPQGARRSQRICPARTGPPARALSAKTFRGRRPWESLRAPPHQAPSAVPAAAQSSHAPSIKPNRSSEPWHWAMISRKVRIWPNCENPPSPVRTGTILRACRPGERSAFKPRRLESWSRSKGKPHGPGDFPAP